jgi:C_GCAxxG_C_C family probable redox protein
MSKVETAVTDFRSGYSCAQSILRTFGEELGLDKDICRKLGSGFGAGMGRMGLTCGAVTGAFMVIGLKYGYIKPDDLDSKIITRELINEFKDKFVARNKTIVCNELIGLDISTPDGFAEFKRRENELYDICSKYVKDAVEILEEILSEV